MFGSIYIKVSDPAMVAEIRNVKNERASFKANKIKAATEFDPRIKNVSFERLFGYGGLNVILLHSLSIDVSDYEGMKKDYRLVYKKPVNGFYRVMPRKVNKSLFSRWCEVIGETRHSLDDLNKILFTVREGSLTSSPIADIVWKAKLEDCSLFRIVFFGRNEDDFKLKDGCEVILKSEYLRLLGE